ncbi:hypothetical protein COHA_001999 [Chlorella ohadii]|uniref:Solute-binding protein family 3/N-terminal domain-containing protein n=1 Tax=Chlorella ohadii TaxID=2649997 RepID=A0AAD5DUS6_9CHLO|nr:hypothetical protein COHA_001999 [Chlorella ohadii]
MAATLHGYRAQEVIPRLRLGVVPSQARPRIFQDDQGAWSGFEVGLIEALSGVTDLGFEWVWLPGLQDRVDALANDTVDFVLSGFGATTAREEVIDFVLPAYYTTAAALFTPDGAAPEGVKTWEDLKGKRVAALASLYDPQLGQKLGIEEVPVASAEEAEALIGSGQAVGFLADSTNLDLQPTKLKAVADLQPLGPIPLAVAVAQGDAELAQKLSDAMLQLFWNGATSTIQELEKKWFGAGGLPPNEAVAKLVESLKAGQPVDKAGPLFTLFDSGSSSS